MALELKKQIEDLVEFQNTRSITFLYRSEKKHSKSLKCTLRGNYEVLENDKVIFETTQPFAAIEKYNSIQINK
jgi:hypothetical protein